MPQTYTIDGITYRMIEKSTIRNDFYIMKQYRAAGLDKCLQQTSETADDFANRILSIAIDSGIPFTLLGGMLIPEGIPDNKWTPEHAEATAERLSMVTAPEDKELIQQIVVQAVIDFFAAALRLSNSSLYVLPAAGGAAHPNGMNSSMTTANGAALSVN